MSAERDGMSPNDSTVRPVPGAVAVRQTRRVGQPRLLP